MLIHYIKRKPFQICEGIIEICKHPFFTVRTKLHPVVTAHVINDDVLITVTTRYESGINKKLISRLFVLRFLARFCFFLRFTLGFLAFTPLCEVPRGPASCALFLNLRRALSRTRFLDSDFAIAVPSLRTSKRFYPKDKYLYRLKFG